MAWIDRAPTHEQYTAYCNLIDLHRMTLAWVNAVAAGTLNMPDHLSRVSSPGIRETLEKLENLGSDELPARFEEILKEWDPDDLIPAFDRIVKSLQAWIIQVMLERTPSSEHESLINILENASFSAGSKIAELRWNEVLKSEPFTLELAYQAFIDSPLGLGGQKGILLEKRRASHTIEIESGFMPMQSPYWEMKSVAPLITKLSIQWIRGFMYKLNSQILVSEFSTDRNETTGLKFTIHSESPRSLNVPIFL